MKPTSCLTKHKFVAIGGEAKWLYKENKENPKEPYVQMVIVRCMHCLYCCETKDEIQMVNMSIDERLQIPY